MLIGFGNGLNRRESEEKICRSPMLVHLEWFLSLQIGQLGLRLAGGVGRLCGVSTMTYLLFFFFPSLSKFSVLFTPNFVSLLNSLFGLIIVFCTLLSLRHKKWVSL